MKVGDEVWMTLEASGWRTRALKAEAKLASLAAQDGLVEALRIARVYVQNVVDAEGKAFNAKDLAQIDAALASIEVKS